MFLCLTLLIFLKTPWDKFKTDSNNLYIIFPNPNHDVCRFVSYLPQVFAVLSHIYKFVIILSHIYHFCLIFTTFVSYLQVLSRIYKFLSPIYKIVSHLPLLSHICHFFLKIFTNVSYLQFCLTFTFLRLIFTTFCLIDLTVTLTLTRTLVH